MEPTITTTPPLQTPAPASGPALPPTYQEILRGMGEQLSQRKSALMKRVLLIVWPFLLLIVIWYFASDIFDYKTLNDAQQLQLMAAGVLYIILAAIYSSIMSFIFQIEKQIWVDSYFDQKNLPLEESWGIAKMLFWPAFIFRIKLFLRYYLGPIVIAVAAFIALSFALVQNVAEAESLAPMIAIGSLVLLVAIGFYIYYIRIKLRYSWFLFLDKYGVQDSFGHMVEDMNKLNAVSRSETFKKSLLANIGTDSVNVLAQMTVSTISLGLSQLGGGGQMLGGLVRAYGQELSRQAADLGNIAAQYMLYRFARKEAFGSEQEVNENIYRV